MRLLFVYENKKPDLLSGQIDLDEVQSWENVETLEKFQILQHLCGTKIDFRCLLNF